LLSLTLPVALLAGGCDRETTGDAQQQENSVTAKADASAEELTGTLDRSHAGEPIPAVTVTDPSGASLALATTKGKPVLLNLWATWCAPCVTEMPLLDRLAGDLGDGVRVLTVSEDMKGAELVAPFFAGRDLPNLPQWMDPKNDLAFAFDGGASLPLTVLYDAEGKEVWRVLGGYDWSSAEARTLIEEALPAT
jgi:thiol-disulfide isomerase/thioredoxin